jgi:hypothetical protein
MGSADASEQAAGVTMSWRRAVVVWCALLAVGAFLLAGRYDFAEAGGAFARAGYLSTLYFLVIVPPLTHVLAARLGAPPQLAWAFGIAVLAIASAPYRWLGLGHLRHVIHYFEHPKTEPIWFPRAIHDPGAPNERLILGLALVIAVVVALAFARARRRDAVVRRALPGILLSAVVVVQAGLHTSTRSPYTLIPRIETIARPWYRLNLFPNGQGAVNGDAHYFTGIDDHLKGVPKPVDPLVLRRSFPHWLASHATFFFNPFYVYLILNVGLWIAAALAMYGWVHRIASREAAMLAAGISVSLTGFIVYVAQPMSYFAALAALPIVMWGLEAFLVDAPRAPIAFGALFGLAAATYDLLPLVPCLAVYGWRRGVPWRAIAVSLLLGIAVYAGWPLLQHGILRVPTKSNLDVASGAITTTIDLLRTGEIGALVERVVRGIAAWATSLLWAFSGVTTVIAAGGLFVASSEQRRLIGIVMIPSLLVVVLLIIGNARWGQVRLGELPRFVTISWPAVVLTAALLLERCGRFGRALPWVVVGAIALFHNAGAFGFVRFDYHFYWPTPIGCDPYGATACTGP